MKSSKIRKGNEMGILLYLDESEVSLIFKSLRKLRSFGTETNLDDLFFRLRLLHGDLDEEDYDDGTANDSNDSDDNNSTERA